MNAYGGYRCPRRAEARREQGRGVPLGRVFACAVVALGMISASQAVAGDGLWRVFEARCLIPYERVARPDTRGLTRDGDVWRGAAYPLTVSTNSCAVTGGTPGDLAGLLAGRQDYAALAGGVWQSTTWREPRIEVEALADGYLVRETDLES